MQVDPKLNKPNKVYATGYVTVSEKINGPIDILYDINRCDLSNENCEKYSSMKASVKIFSNFSIAKVDFF